MNGSEQVTTLKSEVRDGVLVFTIQGTVDSRNTSGMKDLVRDAFRKHSEITGSVIDFKGVDFMDSSGLGLVISALKSCRERNGKFSVCKLKEEILMIFHLCKLDQVLTIHDDLDSAVAAVKE